MAKKSELMRVSPEFKKMVRALKKSEFESDAHITKELTNFIRNKKNKIIEL